VSRSFADAGPGDIGALAASMRGARLQDAQSGPHAWTFEFDEGRSLRVECAWRVRDERAVVISSADDGQRFGHDRPANVRDLVRERLVGRRAVDFGIDAATGDIDAEFDRGLRLQTFTESTGYEAWTLSHQGRPIAVAIGGGSIRAIREG
jgi:hypothetical protein